jgi:hypothetical protein
MSTRYPVTLPDVPPGGWNGEVLQKGDRGVELHGELCGDASQPWLLVGVDAPDAAVAEVRALAWVAASGGDDMRGCLSAAELEQSCGRWSVRLQW